MSKIPLRRREQGARNRYTPPNGTLRYNTNIRRTTMSLYHAKHGDPTNLNRNRLNNTTNRRNGVRLFFRVTSLMTRNKLNTMRLPNNNNGVRHPTRNRGARRLTIIRKQGLSFPNKRGGVTFDVTRR